MGPLPGKPSNISIHHHETARISKSSLSLQVWPSDTPIGYPAYLTLNAESPHSLQHPHGEDQGETMMPDSYMAIAEAMLSGVLIVHLWASDWVGGSDAKVD